jgi:hypothetical protein
MQYFFLSIITLAAANVGHSVPRDFICSFIDVFRLRFLVFQRSRPRLIWMPSVSYKLGETMLIVSRAGSGEFNFCSVKKLVWFTWRDGYFQVPNFLTHVSIPKHVTYLIYYQKKRKSAICYLKEWALHGGMDFFQVPNSHSCLLVDVTWYAHVYDILHIVPYMGI